MSNFETLAQITECNISTSPNLFSASTVDSYATLTTAGYLNDLSAKIKTNDLFYINYNDTSTYPLKTGEASVLTLLQVTYNPSSQNWSLTPTNLNQSGQSLLASFGFHSATASSTTTAATSTYSDTKISANAVAFARWPVAATAGTPEKVTAGNGLLTVLNSATSGVSTIAYFSIIPSLLLQNSGVYVAKYVNAGGSATIVITDPLVLAGSIVVANLLSSANAVRIQKVTPTAGTLTILCSADPGASVVSYLSVTASTGLAAQGCYAASYVNAGGSATLAITDANITANSIVMADSSALTNAVYIQKVTPTASTLTILFSADPGASTISYIATSVAS